MWSTGLTLRCRCWDFHHSSQTAPIKHLLFVDCHFDWTESHSAPATEVYSDRKTRHLSTANPTKGSSRADGRPVRCLMSSTYYILSTLWRWLELLMGFHVNVWVTGDLIERDCGTVRANGTTHWSSYHRFRKETKRRKMTIDCLSANNRCETVRVWPI